jgi:hypothetical protein
MFKIQTPGNYPEESIQHSEQGESLNSGSFGKSTTTYLWYYILFILSDFKINKIEHHN